MNKKKYTLADEIRISRGTDVESPKSTHCFLRPPILFPLLLAGIFHLTAIAAQAGNTQVSIVGDNFYINGKPTYAGRSWKGHRVEGLLLNTRVVIATFDDLNPETVKQWAYPDTGKWDAERNVREFIAALPEWKSHGLLGISLNFEGGSPAGYVAEQPWENQPFNPDGSLRPDYMSRMKRVLDEADRLGLVAIVGYFYGAQSRRLETDENAIRATDKLTKWLLDGGWRNVLVEINNETRPDYQPPILRPDRVHELIARVRDAKSSEGRRLLVGTSFPVNVMPSVDVIRASDYVMLHGNGFRESDELVEKIQDTRALDPKHVIPVVVSEDTHSDFAADDGRLAVCVGVHVSWGWLSLRRPVEGPSEGYQSPPVNWGLSSEKKRAFFQAISEVSGIGAQP